MAEGKVDVAMQLLSEVQSAKDTTVVGLLPPGLQNFVVYGAAIPAYNEKPEAAVAFVKFLSAPDKRTSGRPPVSNCWGPVTKYTVRR